MIYNSGAYKEYPWTVDSNYYYSFITLYGDPFPYDTIVVDKASGRRIGVRRKGELIFAPAAKKENDFFT